MSKGEHISCPKTLNHLKPKKRGKTEKDQPISGHPPPAKDDLASVAAQKANNSVELVLEEQFLSSIQVLDVGRAPYLEWHQDENP